VDACKRLSLWYRLEAVNGTCRSNSYGGRRRLAQNLAVVFPCLESFESVYGLATVSRLILVPAPSACKLSFR
jgi:hypothetical protein